MKKSLVIVASLLMLGMSVTSFAKPEKGWHRGNYLLVGLGSMNVDEDTNVLTNRVFGNSNILGYGLTYGWNFLDFLAAELQLRYGTDSANNQKEHAANIDFLLKYSLILDVLTRNEVARFLPFVKAGAGIFGAAVPDTSAGNDRFGVFGPAGIFGTGMEVLIAKLFYAGVDFNMHLVNLQEKRNSNNVRILAGGFDPQYSVFGYFGVHF